PLPAVRVQLGEAVPGQVDQVGGDLFQLGLARVEPPLPGERDHADQHLGVQRGELGIVAAGGEEVGQDVLDLAGDVAQQRAVGAGARAGVGVPDQDAEAVTYGTRSEEHTSELQSRGHLVCRLLLEKKNKKMN